ncbi:MAG: DUF4230 domain-containing protein [Patescibacteria group bacterium]
MKTFFIKFVVLLVVVGGIAWFGWYTFMSKPSLRFGTDRAAVITQMQSLSRLETASFTIDKIIEAGTDYNSLNQILFGDKLLLIAHGEVIAGYDLSKLTPEDFSGAGKSIAVTLPPPEIFTVRLDNEKTRVFDRDQGFLTKGNLNLEAEARQQAEQSIRQAACEGDILGTAEKNVKSQLEIIFKAAGFTEVTIMPANDDVTLACS